MRLSPRAQSAIRAELHRQAPRRGMSKRAAYDLGVSQKMFCAYAAGRVNIPEYMAWRILEKARLDDLALADKIEAELLKPSLLKECE